MEKKCCWKCGQENSMDATFCEKCGTNLKEKTIDRREEKPVVKSKTNVVKWFKIIIPVLLLVVGGYVAAQSTGGIQLKDYFVASVSGDNGEGQLTYSYDFDTLCEDVFGPTPELEKIEDMEAYFEYALKVEELKNNLVIDWPSNTRGLSNGDKVEFNVSLKEDYKNDKLKSGTYTYTVSNLATLIKDDTSKEEELQKMNALLVGIQYDLTSKESDVSNWDEKTILEIISSKLLWDSYDLANDYLKNKGLARLGSEDGYWTYDLEMIKKVAKGAFGKDLSSSFTSDDIKMNNDQFLIMPITGESISLKIQDYGTKDDKIIAVGTAIHHYNNSSEFLGYFVATMKKNSDSIYGYTLVSLETVKGNQSFMNLDAYASSYLKEATVIHSPNRVIDGKLSTSWVESVSGSGESEWIELVESEGKLMEISAIKFNLGYQANQSLLTKNGWPSRLLIEDEDGNSQEVVFYNYDDVVLLNQPMKTSSITITILEAEVGTHFDDTCISEIQLLGLDSEKYYADYQITKSE